jgi:tetratricopeptide (TPR) repeat protein
MKAYYDNWQEFTDLIQKIERACADRGDKTFIIDDYLSNLEPFKEIETTSGFTPEECIDRGKKELANGRFSPAIGQFNAAEQSMNQDDPLWGCLYFYRSLAYSKKGMKTEAERDYKKAEALKFNKITIPIYKIRTYGPKVLPGCFAAKRVRKLQSNDNWINAQGEARAAASFFHGFAKILWQNFQDKDPEADREIINESMDEVMEEVKYYLLTLKNDFSERRIRDVQRIVSKELNRPVKPTQSKSPFISVKDKPESKRRRVNDNYALAFIIELYRKYTDMKIDRQIQFNMALALDAVNFWPERIP